LTNENNVLLEKKIIKVFEVSSNLILTINLNKDKLSPNDELKIDGDVKNVRGELVKTGQVKILLDEEESSINLDKGKFSYDYKIPGNIKSNSHSLDVIFEDDYGNSASKEFSIFINPKPTRLKNLLNKIDFLPGDQVSIESLLYDQADDLIENNADIKVYNPKNDLIREGNYKLEFTLEQYALPGTWLVKSSTDDFKIESAFNVEEVKKVQTYVEDGVLYVKNIGNVDFDDNIEITAIGEDGKQFTKKIKINPKESKIIELSDELTKGQYKLDINAGSQKESFEDINVPERDDVLYVTGKSIQNSTNKLIDQPYLALMIILVIGLLFYVIRNTKKVNRMIKEKEIQKGYIKAREIEQEKIKQGIKPRRFDIDENEAKDFTERMLKNINEKKDESHGYLYRNPKKENKGNSFGLFK
jgi:hypothetical protein